MPDHPSTSYLLSFPCTHIYHVSCLLRYNKPPDYEIPSYLARFDTQQKQPRIAGAGFGGPDEDDYNDDDFATRAGPEGWDRGVGMKLDHAALLRDVVRELGGCPLEVGREGEG